MNIKYYQTILDSGNVIFTSVVGTRLYLTEIVYTRCTVRESINFFLFSGGIFGIYTRVVAVNLK